jgi:hypothetical protein
MTYLLIYENGNGYHCGCCRREWEAHETMDFESDEALKEHIVAYNKLYDENRWDNDSRIIRAYPLSSSSPAYDG